MKISSAFKKHISTFYPLNTDISIHINEIHSILTDTIPDKHLRIEKYISRSISHSSYTALYNLTHNNSQTILSQNESDFSLDKPFNSDFNCKNVNKNSNLTDKNLSSNKYNPTIKLPSNSIIIPSENYFSIKIPPKPNIIKESNNSIITGGYSHSSDLINLLYSVMPPSFKLTSLQQSVLPSVLSNRNSLFVSPTSTGKTIVLLLFLLQEHISLINNTNTSSYNNTFVLIAPYKALIHQHYSFFSRVCNKIGVRVVEITTDSDIHNNSIFNSCSYTISHSNDRNKTFDSNTSTVSNPFITSDMRINRNNKFKETNTCINTNPNKYMNSTDYNTDIDSYTNLRPNPKKCINNTSNKTTLIITTPEKLEILTRNQKINYNLLLIDEIHLLSSKRGVYIESVISRLIYSGISRIVGVSATVSNWKHVCNFLRVEKNDCYIYDESYRPIKIGYEFVETNSNIKGVNDRSIEIKGSNDTLNKQQGVNNSKKFINNNPLLNNILIEITLKHINCNSILIFTHSRKDTYDTALQLVNNSLISNTLNKEDRTKAVNSALLMFNVEEEVSNYKGVSNKDSNYKGVNTSTNKQRGVNMGHISIDSIITLLYTGVGIHHSGLSKNVRNLTEYLFEKGVISILVSTSTLAWGVNLPAWCVIIKGCLYKNNKELSDVEVMQMFGRCGRTGFDNRISNTSSDSNPFLTLDKCINSNNITNNTLDTPNPSLTLDKCINSNGINNKAFPTAILISNTNIYKYISLITNTQPLISFLNTFFIDFFNSLIFTGVNTLELLLLHLKNTFYYCTTYKKGVNYSSIVEEGVNLLIELKYVNHKGDISNIKGVNHITTNIKGVNSNTVLFPSDKCVLSCKYFMSVNDFNIIYDSLEIGVMEESIVIYTLSKLSLFDEELNTSINNTLVSNPPLTLTDTHKNCDSSINNTTLNILKDILYGRSYISKNTKENLIRILRCCLDVCIAKHIFNIFKLILRFIRCIEYNSLYGKSILRSFNTVSKNKDKDCGRINSNSVRTNKDINSSSMVYINECIERLEKLCIPFSVLKEFSLLDLKSVLPVGYKEIYLLVSKVPCFKGIVKCSENKEEYNSGCSVYRVCVTLYYRMNENEKFSDERKNKENVHLCVTDGLDLCMLGYKYLKCVEGDNWCEVRVLNGKCSVLRFVVLSDSCNIEEEIFHLEVL